MAMKRQYCSSSFASMSPPPPPKLAATKAPLRNLTQQRLLELPNDLIVEILSRLPVKSISRFRCVCKSWDSLFYDPRFLKKHVNLAQRKLLVNSRPIFLKSFQVSNLFLDESGTNSQVLRFPTNSKQYVRIVGSCNGLVCLNVFNRGNESIYFWNPSTKQSIKLPYTFAVRDCNVFGFGFDDSINEFKLVRIFLESLSELTRFSVEIYGMWEGSRRRIAFFPHGFPYTRTEAIFLNGAMHKVAVRGQKSVVNGETITKRNWFIVALDIVNETFREVPQPELEDGAFKFAERTVTLYSVGDLLCVVRSYRESHGDVWIMKEYGVKESWFKLVRIPCVSVPSPVLCRLKPIYFSEKDGEMLLVIRDQMVLFRSKGNEFRHLRLPGVNLKSKFFIQFKTHVENLFSPSVMMKLRGEPSHKKPEY